MISFNNLGNLGRLGNQMFQYAALKGIANYRGYDFCIPPRNLFGRNDHNVRYSECILYDVFNLEEKNIVKVTSNNFLQEGQFHFNEEILENCPDEVDLYGYFQTEKYFSHIKDQIKEDFTFKSDLLFDCQNFFRDSFDTQEVISLHIRRGDYVLNENHPVQSIQYYEKALNQFSKSIPVLVFSDDPIWCSEQNIFKPDRFYISQGNTTEVDLCLMSLATYHIIANSSFSWWGAWLANSKKVIAPKNWFAGDCINHNTKDLYCSDWILM